MLLRKLWRTMRRYKAPFISMILMIALGIGVFVGFNMEWVSIRENPRRLFDETGLADFRILSETGFSEDDLQKVKDIKGVDAATRFLSVVADVKEKPGDSVTLAVTADANISGMLVTDGVPYDVKSSDGIWLSDSYAAANDIKVGDTLTLTYKNLSLTGSVRGVGKSGEYMICVRDETQLMPDYTTFGFAYISPVMYEKAMGFAYYPQIFVLSDMEKSAFVDAVDETLAGTPLILTKEENGSYAGAEGETDEGKTIGSVLPVLFLLIAVLTMVTTMHRLVAKEKTQIGTMKALGFRDRRILWHYTAFALVIGVLGSVIGIALGYGLAYLIMSPNGMMGTYMDMPYWSLHMPWFCTVAVIAVIALLTLIGFLSTRQMLCGNAADALRPYTPKKMRQLLIERTRAFHRLPFGTRWNLRDVIRHKARTAMSLIGVVGCTLLIVAALGMQDTMAAFLDVYYNGATQYASRIYLSEEATEKERAAIAEKYDGDTGTTLSVQLNDKAIALDIYTLHHNLVRFPDEDDQYVELPDDGVYICRRIADANDLAAGDTVTVSPFGSDKTYTLRVAGVVRSISENIVLSDTYADKCGIPHTVDSVYTKAEKAEITADSAIKSVQSKQMIVDSFDTFMELMYTSVTLLVVGALALGTVVLYNLGVMSYTERYREMATLKVLGFRDRQIGRLLISQNLWVSVIGILIGIPLGVFTLSYMLDVLASEYEMMAVVSPLTYVISIVLTLGMSLLVSLLVARKNRRIDMVESLKGAE